MKFGFTSQAKEVRLVVMNKTKIYNNSRADT